ncbi:dihydroneopterin aldolase [Microbacterium sp. Sa4CUA7]|uniref:7,8-dihydroneopterin aldolase n=1 Tax=Microbacterium pullorum TaxID=2762236 RepID=A0ABR8S5K8_9MICO|nr:dihydroneopterin aldolase [Microbacterium pullorum]MBD7958364.1 dihydroneopterin aldolase [Microbacterium pullorum]
MTVFDEIAVTGIRAYGHHGVYPDERRDGQEFVADVVLFLSTAEAAQSDDVSDTVHYGELAEHVAAILAGDPVDLLETLAARIADAVLAHDLVERARVTVHKPAAPIPVPFSDVAVTITRGRMP